MADFIDLSISADAKGAIKELREINKEQGKVIKGLQKTTRASKETAKSGRDMGRSIKSEMAGMATSFVTVGAAAMGIRTMLHGILADTKENTRAATEYQNKLLGLRFLNNNVFSPEQFKRITAMGTKSGIMPGPAVDAAYNWQSATGELPKAAQMEGLEGVFQWSKTSNIPVAELVKPMSKLWNITQPLGYSMPQNLNLVKTLMDKSGASEQDIIQQLPILFASGMIADLSPQTSSAMFASGSQTLGAPETATGLQALFSMMTIGVEKNKTRTGKWARKVGFDKLSGEEKLDKLAEAFADETLEPSDFAETFGKRGQRIMKLFTPKGWANVQSTRAEFVDATSAGGRNIIAEQFNEARKDPGYARALTMKVLTAETERRKADAGISDWSMRMAQIDAETAEGGFGNLIDRYASKAQAGFNMATGWMAGPTIDLSNDGSGWGLLNPLNWKYKAGWDPGRMHLGFSPSYRKATGLDKIPANQPVAQGQSPQDVMAEALQSMSDSAAVAASASKQAAPREDVNAMTE